MNQRAALTQQQLNNSQYLGLTQLQQQALAAPYQAMLAQQQMQMQADAANKAFLSGLITTGATVAAASDAELKTDIRSGHEAAKAFLDSLKPKTYVYKDQANPLYHEGKQLGIIAQDLPSQFVAKGPDGKRWISANVIGQVLAGLGTVHKRLSVIEGGKR
jgi:hypothetical protein